MPEQQSSYYSADAYNPEYSRPEPGKRHWFYRFRLIKNRFSWLPWGHYLGCESAAWLRLSGRQHKRGFLHVRGWPPCQLLYMDHEEVHYKQTKALPLLVYIYLAMLWGYHIYTFFSFAVGETNPYAPSLPRLVITCLISLGISAVLYYLFPFTSRVVFNRRTGLVTWLRLLLPNIQLPFSCLDAFSSCDPSDREGSPRRYSLMILHPARITAADFSHAATLGSIYLQWQALQRFMDVTQPLPDIPRLEPFRHLDPVTAAHDKEHRRPENYWRDQTPEEIETLAERLAEQEKSINPVWPCPMAQHIPWRNPDNPAIGNFEQQPKS